MGLWTFSPTSAGDRWRDGNGEKIWCFNMLKLYKLMLRKISGFEWGRKPTLILTVMKIIYHENLNLEKNLNRHKCFSNYLQRCRIIYLFVYYYFVYWIIYFRDHSHSSIPISLPLFSHWDSTLKRRERTRDESWEWLWLIVTLISLHF